MGIRFTCPNGHKLNVKAFLAGRAGFCPFCGVRVEIPLESTRGPSRKKSAGGAGPSDTPHSAPLPASGGAPPAVHPPAQPQVAAAVMNTLAAGPTSGKAGPLPKAAAPVAVGSVPQTPSPVAASAVPANPRSALEPTAVFSTPIVGSDFSAKMEALAAAPPPAPQSPARSTPSDPLAEAPDAVWYVRPPSGGQFGPAAASVMRAWLLEGRVSADCLVWREGWRDWQEACGVFPQLQADGLAGLPKITKPITAHSATYVPRKSLGTQAVIISLLFIAVVVLGVVFVWVLMRQEPQSTPSPASEVTKPAAVSARFLPDTPARLDRHDTAV